MTKYLLDTNVLLRLVNPSDLQHEIVSRAIATLLKRSDECYVTAQVLVELWVVATRPTDVNGLGWSVKQTSKIIEQLLYRFPIAEETPQVVSIWLDLVNKHRVKGKRTHDVRIAAVMLVNNIHHILTLNPNDFKSLSAIITIHPKTLNSAS